MKMYDIGFLGGGQLARMSIQAAQRMGLRCLSLDPGEVTPASQIADNIVAPLDSVDAVRKVFDSCGHVTLENEFIPAGVIERAMPPDASVLPSTVCLATIQDKLLQRFAYDKHGAPTPRAVPIDDDGSSAIREIGFPMVLKARFGGYDGKGTRYANDRSEFDALASDWSTGGWMAEQFVPFERELAVMVCRSKEQVIAFPTMQTVQTNHVCDLVFPTDTDASDVAVRAVEAVRGYGLFGVELFVAQDGRLLINEIAPRPHNTGHYSLDWGGVSQFEAHVRLVLGLSVPEPLGQSTCMANLLGISGAGDHRKGIEAAIAADTAVYVHWYGKQEPRPGRKMGHLNAVGDDCKTRAIAARARFYDAWERA